MNYIVNRELRKFHEGFSRNDYDIDTLIIHCTAGGSSANSCIKWMSNGGLLADGTKREKDYKKGIALFHYLIDLNGDIYEIINPHNFVYHSSTGIFDKTTIGIELVNTDRNNSKPVTKEQYKALAELYLFINNNINKIDNIYGHGAIKMIKTGKNKVCPGLGFDWYKFLLELTKSNINAKLFNNDKHIEITV